MLSLFALFCKCNCFNENRISLFYFAGDCLFHSHCWCPSQLDSLYCHQASLLSIFSSCFYHFYRNIFGVFPYTDKEEI